MFDKWLKLPAHYYLRITAFTILMVGIALSNVLMSIGAIWIISNWLIEADFQDYKERLKKNPIAWLFLAFLAFSFLSLLWTEDIAYAIKDLMVKLPFFVIPLVMSLSKPIKNKVFYYLIYVFLGIIIFTSVLNYVWYNYYFEDANDIRKMSRFLSHVRYSILIDLGIFSAVYLILKRKLNVILLVTVILWLLFYTYKAQILNGYMLLMISGIYSVFYFLKKIKGNVLRKIALTTLTLVITVSVVLVKRELNSVPEIGNNDYSNLEERTLNGNRYYHDTINPDFENGNPIWVYVCQDELKKAWNQRSSIDYKGNDLKGQPMFGTLLRYMTSKNLRKDSLGLTMLSDEEISDIENGHTSIKMNTSGVSEKFNAFKVDYSRYKNGGDPNGHSLMQRMEHLRVALSIVKNNWIVGVGIGDVNMAFEEEYKKSNSKLLPENQHRSHNQFLTIWISHGLFGVFLFLSMILFPVLNQKNPDYFLVIVCITLLVSCFFQDMIETQAGATIFGLFYAITAFRENELAIDN